MHVLLTGATGFVGAHLARRLLHDGCRVSALLRPTARLDRIADLLPQMGRIDGDLAAPARYAAALRADPPDLCVHLAWYAVPGRYLHATENLAWVTASLALLEALHAVGCPRTVFVGTCVEYDTSYGYLSETTPARPASLYAACKHSLYLTGAQFQARQGRSFAWPRLFYQYGPWEDARRLVPLIIGKLRAGDPCPLTVGSQIRDYLHISDVAGAIWAVAQSALEGPVNIGSGQPISVAALAQQVGALLGRPDLLQLGAIPLPPGEPPFICANPTLLRTTGWQPQYDLRTGVADTVAWWQAQSHAAGDTR